LRGDLLQTVKNGFAVLEGDFIQLIHIHQIINPIL
jgi:hypothetical protein